MPTHADPRVFRNADDWRRDLARAPVRVQWDPERSLDGQKLEARSIQVGLSRHIIGRYVDDWILGIEDLTPLAREIHGLVREGRRSQAGDLLPGEDQSGRRRTRRLEKPPRSAALAERRSSSSPGVIPWSAARA